MPNRIIARVIMAQEWKTGGASLGGLNKRYGQKRYTSAKAVKEILKSLDLQGFDTTVTMEGEYTIITA